VLEIAQRSGDDLRMAYLYGFGVDRVQLRSEHERWLEDNLIGPAISQAMTPTKRAYPGGIDPRGVKVYPGAPVYTPPSRIAPSIVRGDKLIITVDGGDNGPVSRLVVPERWEIWLHGTASRPGKLRHNLALSRRRADSVALWIDLRFRASSVFSDTVRYEIDRHWYGELLADVQRKPEGSEDPLDRAVLIAFRRVYPSVSISLRPPAPLQRPLDGVMPCCLKKLEMEYYEVVQFLWSIRQPLAFRDDGSGRYTSPDPIQAHVNLRLHGWTSEERREYMIESAPFMKAKLEDAMSMPDIIGKAMKQLDKLKCYDSDPDDFCHNDINFSKDYRGTYPKTDPRSFSVPPAL